MYWLWLIVSALVLVTQAQAQEIQHWRTERGAKVYFIENRALPMVDVRVVFNAGSARDKLQGVALLANRLLDTGTADRDADEIAEALENVGAQLEYGVQSDMAVVSLRSLSDEAHLSKAIEVFADVIAAPSYPKTHFERERTRVLQQIQNQQLQPDDTAERLFYRAVYRDHPYAHRPQGTEESVSRILSIHLRRFHQRYYVAKNAVIALVGDISRDRAEILAHQVSIRLQMGEPAPLLPDVPPLSEATLETQELRTQQSHIFMGQPGVQRGDPDYYDLYVGNHILGGSGFASVLMEVIREQRGLAYSVYSALSPMLKPGPFLVGMQTRNEQVSQAVELLQREITAFVAKGPSQAQLDAAIKNITGSAPLRTDSNKKWVKYLALIGFYQLPIDYLATFNQRIREVTVDSVKAAWQRRIQPDKLATVIVGQRDPEQ